MSPAAALSHEMQANSLHARLVDGRVDLQAFICNLCDEDLDETMLAWLTADAEVSITQHFSLSFALDDSIEWHQMPARGGAIDLEYKPLFDAMRAELVAMLTRLDALVFVDPSTEVAPS